MIKRVGSYTLKFSEPPVITGYGSVAGKKEAEGPLGKCFGKIIYDVCSIFRIVHSENVDAFFDQCLMVKIRNFVDVVFLKRIFHKPADFFWR